MGKNRNMAPSLGEFWEAEIGPRCVMGMIAKCDNSIVFAYANELGEMVHENTENVALLRRARFATGDSQAVFDAKDNDLIDRMAETYVRSMEHFNDEIAYEIIMNEARRQNGKPTATW